MLDSVGSGKKDSETIASKSDELNYGSEFSPKSRMVMNYSTYCQGTCSLHPSWHSELEYNLHG